MMFADEIDGIYSKEFLNDKFDLLNVSDDKRAEFSDFLKQTSVSYLSAIDMNTDRVQPNQQKKIFENYVTALKEAQRRYREIQESSPTNGNFHKALRAKVEKIESDGLKEMFHPYVYYSDNEEELQGGISIALFDDFLEALIETAQDAPSFIGKNDKANLEKDFILWWLARIGSNWLKYTDTPFTLGDWYTNKELNIVDEKKGQYMSLCLDVLQDLLKAVDKKITRSDVETAMRKFKKIYILQ